MNRRGFLLRLLAAVPAVGALVSLRNPAAGAEGPRRHGGTKYAIREERLSIQEAQRIIADTWARELQLAANEEQVIYPFRKRRR